MALSINNNLFSINAQRNLAGTQNLLGVSMARLSSGLRVNSAKDDAAGLAVAAGMMNQARGMDVAIRNANDGLSLLQVADGALSSMGDILQRMRELAVQSLNGTYSTDDRAKLDLEYQELGKELVRVQSNVKFNGTELFDVDSVTGALTLDGDGNPVGSDFSLQIGANAGDTITFTTTGVDVSGLGDVKTVGVAGTPGNPDPNNDGDTSDAIAAVPGTGATGALEALDAAINSVNSERAVYGASMSRLDNVIVNLRTGYEAQMASYSRIMDADFARETANLSKAQILQQAGVAMVAQANAVPQNVLALLR